MNIRVNAYYRLNGASAGMPSNSFNELQADLAASFVNAVTIVLASFLSFFFVFLAFAFILGLGRLHRIVPSGLSMLYYPKLDVSYRSFLALCSI